MKKSISEIKKEFAMADSEMLPCLLYTSEECDLTEADFRDCNLAETVFTGANLTRADFRGAKDYVISPQDNRVRRAKFSFPEVMSLLRCLEIEIE